MITPEQADAAYEKGWVDSLDGRSDPLSVSTLAHCYWYHQGWQACADYRWQDRSQRGVAADRAYRVPRPSK